MQGLRQYDSLVLPDSPVSLRLLPEDLAATMRSCSVVHLRRGATRAAMLAMTEAGLTDPRVDAALAALESGRTGEGSARDAIAQLVEELDTIAWAAQDRDEAEEFDRIFRLARAANALWSALDVDPTVAAADAAYEAFAAVGSWEPLIALWA
jgi:hypothetical protein